MKFLLATLTLCLSTAVMADSSSEDAMAAIKAAKAAQKEASSYGFETLEIEKAIINAETAANEGNNKKAIKLSNIISAQMSAVCY
jgi:hypothetical protein